MSIIIPLYAKMLSIKFMACRKWILTVRGRGDYFYFFELSIAE